MLKQYCLILHNNATNAKTVSTYSTSLYQLIQLHNNATNVKTVLIYTSQ
jgi:hypothetical protein